MSGGTIYRAECIIGECVHLPVVGKLVQMGREYQIEIKLCLAPLPIWSKAFTIGRCTFFLFIFLYTSPCGQCTNGVGFTSFNVGDDLCQRLRLVVVHCAYLFFVKLR